jgi:hypothetical protein
MTAPAVAGAELQLSDTSLYFLNPGSDEKCRYQVYIAIEFPGPLGDRGSKRQIGFSQESKTARVQVHSRLPKRASRGNV